MNASALDAMAGSRRIACLWFPHWALHRRRRIEGFARETEGAPPLVLVREGTRGSVIHDADEAALACGLLPGGRVTDALSSTPGLVTVPADPHGDREALARAAAWCRRWAPHTRAIGGAWGDATIALDTTGCAHLHGGEARMLDAMAERWSRFGYAVRLAVAPTLGAALAHARYGEDRTLVPGNGLAASLGSLPVEALRIGSDTALVLKRLGLKTIGQLDAVPRKALGRRFTRRHAKSDRDLTWDDIFERGGGAPGRAPDDPLLMLDRAMGRVAEPLAPTPEAPTVEARTALLEPTDREEAVGLVLGRLLDRVASELTRRGEGAGAMLLCAYRVDGRSDALELRASAPSRDAAHWQRLFAERIGALDAGPGFDAFSLEARDRAPLDERQRDLPSRPMEIDREGDGEETVHARARVPAWVEGVPVRVAANDDGGLPASGPLAQLAPADVGLELALFIDRLSNRLGEDRVRVPVPRDSHWPERAEAWVPAMGRLKKLALAAEHTGSERDPWRADPATPPRPERLLDPPEPIEVIYGLPDGPPMRFRWRRITRRVTRQAGPERIAPEWWREPGSARARDYWRVEDEEGRRFWLFREGLHDDGRGDAPRWFCHGLFA